MSLPNKKYPPGSLLALFKKQERYGDVITALENLIAWEKDDLTQQEYSYCKLLITLFKDKSLKLK